VDYFQSVYNIGLPKGSPFSFIVVFNTPLVIIAANLLSQAPDMQRNKKQVTGFVT